MIADEKREIILEEGTPINVHDVWGAHLYSTQALIGKANKQFMSEISLEYHRKAIVLPELSIPNGATVKNTVTEEDYLVLASMAELYKTEKLSTILRLVKTNATVTVSGLAETADPDGNVFTAPSIKLKDHPVNIEAVSSELRQYKPGLHENAEFLIFMPAIDLEVLDKVEVNAGGRIMKLKIESVDYLSFIGLAVVSVCSETRK
jgi:hypothetical protein